MAPIPWSTICALNARRQRQLRWPGISSDLQGDIIPLTIDNYNSTCDEAPTTISMKGNGNGKLMKNELPSDEDEQMLVVEEEQQQQTVKKIDLHCRERVNDSDMDDTPFDYRKQQPEANQVN